MQLFRYREQERKAGKVPIKTYWEFYFHLKDQTIPGSSARIQIESDEIIMHIVDDKQNNCLAICGKVEIFCERVNEDIIWSPTTCLESVRGYILKCGRVTTTRHMLQMKPYSNQK